MEPHRVTLTFETDDNMILSDVVRLALALKGTARLALSVEYEVCRSEDLDRAIDWAEDPF